MTTITNITAGRASRLVVAGALAFAYQDSGFEDALTGGNLDAAEQVPAGGCFGARATAARNGSRQQLTARDLGLTYTVTAKTADGTRTYTAIGNPGALADAAYDDGALGVSVMVRP